MSDQTPRHFVSNGETRDEYNDWTFNEWLCRPDFADSRKLLMVRATMEPRCCHPFHVHPFREEIIHVVSGRAEQWVGGEYRVLGPGEIAVIPVGLPHGTYNPFDETLVFHAILSPAILPEMEMRAPDPHDVSETEPWRSIRNDLAPCSIARGSRASR
jgi:quercetin dioxygenase-like cupin family protein